MKFNTIRETVLKTGESLQDVFRVVDSISQEKHPDEIAATPRMIALDSFSPERPFPAENRKSGRAELKGRKGRWNLNGNEPHWRRNG